MTVAHIAGGRHLGRGAKRYLTATQAEVLVAIAAHWRVFKRSPKLLHVANMLRRASSTIGGAVNSLIRRGFLLAKYERTRMGLKEIVHVEPTPVAWAELAP